jgi:hypothetical protein
VRADIEKFLGTVTEATAKAISNRIGMPQLDVAKELNRMHGEGAVEREKRKGGGNEYVYWLAAGEAKLAPAAQSSPLARAEQTANPEAFEPPEFREVDAPLAALCEALGFSILSTETPVKEAMRLVRLRTDAAANALDAAEGYRQTIAKLRENNAELERKIDELTIVDAEFVPAPVFVTVGRYAKPARHKTLEKAQRRAASLVRTEKESEVLVLEPVGRVVRGSEWRPA